MEDVQDNLNRAVLAALQPGPLQAEAFEFLQNVKKNAVEAWQPALGCFLAGKPTDHGRWAYRYGGETRLFALQVVDAALTPRTDTPGQIDVDNERHQAVRQQLMDYVHREYVLGAGEESLSYIRNKVVQTFFILFMNMYLTTWPDFFSDFASLLRKHPPSDSALNGHAPFNPRTTDLFLRLLHEVSIEISDADLRLNKYLPRLETDTKLRDAVRARHAAAIAQETFAIVAESLQGLDQPDSDARTRLAGKRATECLEMGVRVVADYVTWIDITLIVTPTWIPFLYQALRLPHLGVRLAAAEALLATVTKGMPPTNRLELYAILGLGDVLGSLVLERKGKGKAATEDEEEGSFHEGLAKVLNGLGVELCRVCDEASADDNVRAAALQSATALLPLLLQVLDDGYWPVASAVLPFVSSILSRYKKEKKMAPQTPITEEKRQFLSRILEIVIVQMRYPSDDVFEWDAPAGPGEEDDEDFVTHTERRKALKTVFDAVGWVEEDMFKELVGRMIVGVVDTVDAGGPPAQALGWQQVELALWVLYLYGEALKGSTAYGPGSFVAVSPEEKKKVQRDREHRIDYSAWPLSPLGEVMSRVCRSKVTAYPHPSVPLQWFECVVRYHDFFQLSPRVIPIVLPAFLDHRGVHQEKSNVRQRCYYLLYRFVSHGRPSLQPHITAELVQDILTSVKDLLIVDAHIAPPDTPGADILTKAAHTPSAFDSQLYLYETVGILVSMLGQHPVQQAALLRSVLEPLIQGLQSNVRTQVASLDDLKAILMVHHFILAIGSVAKGFPDLSARDDRPSVPWAQEFKTATDSILAVTKTLGGLQIVRDAARASFNKIVATIGTEALPHVPVLIDCLLSQLTTTELVDFIAFIAQLIHKYKSQFPPLLDELIAPLFAKVFQSLDTPVTGTDDIMSHSELRRAYFNLLVAMFNGNVDFVLLSPKNMPHLQLVLDSIPHYVGADSALPPDQRVGISVLNRLCTHWAEPVPGGKQPQQNGKAGPVTTVPGLHQYLYEKAVPLCFTIPSKTNFDWGDAASYNVLQEMSALLKNLVNLRGDEFTSLMVGQYLPSIGAPPEPSQALMQAFVTSPDGKQSRKPLVDFLHKMRDLAKSST